MTFPASSLRRRWPLPDAALGERLLAAYSDPGRGYHDVRHLGDVLDRIDELVRHEHCELLAVRLAAWFHDGVYDAQPDAEERSARWAEVALVDAGVASRTVREVARLVRLTAHHQAASGDANGAVLCDADLAILAAQPDRYADYVAGVRKEYARIPEPQFRQGRAEVLRALLSKPTLFHTEYAVQAWESAARANLVRELADSTSR